MRDRSDVNAAIDKITPKLGDNRILAELGALAQSSSLLTARHRLFRCAIIVYFVRYRTFPVTGPYTRHSLISTVDDTNEAVLHS